MTEQLPLQLYTKRNTPNNVLDKQYLKKHKVGCTHFW